MNLSAIKQFLLDKINDNSSKNIYTDHQWFYRIESNLSILLENNQEDIENENIIFLASYVALLTYLDEDHTFYEITQTELQKSAQVIQNQFLVDEKSIGDALEIAIETFLNNNQASISSKLLNDAFLMDLSCPIDGENRLFKVYDQLAAKGVFSTKTQWYDKNLAYLANKSFQTDYAKENFYKHKKNIQKTLKKERKKVLHQNDLILEKELNINENELKQLKKQLSKIKNRDDRGIQTLFRTTSKNHYTLKQLVDDKARIMITINTIVLSLIIGRVIGSEDATNINSQLPFIVFAIINVLSILFAVLGIRPIKTQGKFTEEEIRNKQGNLLYFGNFHKMKYPDFEWGFLQLLNDKDYLYLSLIRDLYYQGVQLQKKFTFIRLSLNIFLLGIILTSLIYLIITINAYNL